MKVRSLVKMVPMMIFVPMDYKFNGRKYNTIRISEDMQCVLRIETNKLEFIASARNGNELAQVLNDISNGLYANAGDTYEVIAYDKDMDIEISLMRTKDYSDARAHALKFGEQCRLDLLLNPENGQPFDWVKLVNANDWDVVYWASYNR